MLKGRARLTRVVGLGNRDRVIKAWENDKSDEKRPRLLLIDGDLDRLTGTRVDPDWRLYRLRVYCFENLILDEGALVEIGRECQTKLSENEIRKLVKFEEIEETVNGQLLSLWVLYAASYQIEKSICTVGFSVFRLASQSRDFPRLSRNRIWGSDERNTT